MEATSSMTDKVFIVELSILDVVLRVLLSMVAVLLTYAMCLYETFKRGGIDGKSTCVCCLATPCIARFKVREERGVFISDAMRTKSLPGGFQGCCLNRVTTSGLVLTFGFISSLLLFLSSISNTLCRMRLAGSFIAMLAQFYCLGLYHLGTLRISHAEAPKHFIVLAIVGFFLLCFGVFVVLCIDTLPTDCYMGLIPDGEGSTLPFYEHANPSIVFPEYYQDDDELLTIYYALMCTFYVLFVGWDLITLCLWRRKLASLSESASEKVMDKLNFIVHKEYFLIWTYTLYNLVATVLFLVTSALVGDSTGFFAGIRAPAFITGANVVMSFVVVLLPDHNNERYFQFLHCLRERCCCCCCLNPWLDKNINFPETELAVNQNQNQDEEPTQSNISKDHQYKTDDPEPESETATLPPRDEAAEVLQPTETEEP